MSILDPKTKTLLQKLMERDTDEQFVEGDIEAFFANPGLWRELPATTLPLEKIVVDRRWWMQLAHYFMTERHLTVRPLPHVNGMQQRAMERYKFEVLNCCITNREMYPDDFRYPSKELAQCPSWDSHSSGGWLAVENIPMPNPGEDYLNDSLMTDLGLKSRLGHRWTTVNDKILPRVAELMGFAPKQVSLMTWEQWNCLGNLLNSFHYFVGEPFPSYASPYRKTESDVVEWCKNFWMEKQEEPFGEEKYPPKVPVGYTCMGALDKLIDGSALKTRERIGFRILIHLDPFGL